jgi:hypothetical protein
LPMRAGALCPSWILYSVCWYLLLILQQLVGPIMYIIHWKTFKKSRGLSSSLVTVQASQFVFRINHSSGINLN